MLIPLIKEHILKRSQQKLPVPEDFSDLQVLVEAQNPAPPCTCDTCDPDLYRSVTNCYLHPHFRIKFEKDSTKNKYGNECYLPPKLSSSTSIANAEAMHLARQTIAYFDCPIQDLNNTQLAALAALHKWRDTRLSDILSPHPNTDFHLLIPEKQMRDILGCINVLFFGRDSCMFHFRWASKVAQDAEAHTQEHAMTGFTIKMLRALPRQSRFEGRWMLDLLGTLVHEAVHVYFYAYACHRCRSAEENLMSHGHGRAWQLVTARLERCFVRFVGLPVDMGRFSGIQGNWAYFYPTPSRHDFSEWRLENEVLTRFYAHDLFGAFEAGAVKRGIKLDEFAKEWWNIESTLEVVEKEGKEYYRLLRRNQDFGARRKPRGKSGKGLEDDFLVRRFRPLGAGEGSC